MAGCLIVVGGGVCASAILMLADRLLDNADDVIVGEMVPDAVGGDHGIDGDGLAALETDIDALVGLIDADDLVFIADGLVRNRGMQRGMQRGMSPPSL